MRSNIRGFGRGVLLEILTEITAKFNKILLIEIKYLIGLIKVGFSKVELILHLVKYVNYLSYMCWSVVCPRHKREPFLKRNLY